MANSIVFLGTGGTIAGSASSAQDNLSYTSGRVALADLLGGLPGLPERLGGRNVRHEQVFQEDSKDLDPAHWQLLAERVAHYLADTGVDGVIITHGTDTLEETAYFLLRFLPAALIAKKPVVMTCAMRPATSLAPDGPQNLRDAAVVACAAGACGVLLVCQGQAHSALHLQKVHPYELNAFDSGEFSPVAVVEETGVRMVGGWPLPAISHPIAGLVQEWARNGGIHWPRVEILMSHAGANGALVRALCASPPAGDAPLAGLVVAGTGNGTIHRDLELALRAALEQGIAVIRTTRCSRGRVLARADGRGSEFPAVDLSPVKARIELMLQLRGVPAV